MCKKNRRTGVTTRLVDKAIQDFFTKGIVFLYEDRYANNFDLATKLYQRFLIRLRTEHIHFFYKYISDNRKIDGINCVVVLNTELFLKPFEVSEENKVYTSDFFKIVLKNNKCFVIPLVEESRIFYNKNYTTDSWTTLIDVYFIFAKFARDYRTDLKQLTQQYPLTKNESTK